MTSLPEPARPTPAQLRAAAGKTVADLLAPGLKVVFIGINPGLYSAATGHHFARPGNRFWPALHEGGLTPRLLFPMEERELLAYGFGITNLVARASAGADELTRDELVEGGRSLAEKLSRFTPRIAAFLGLSAYRSAFDRPGARVGRQNERISGVEIWVLPNPSGLNAHYQSRDFAALFAALKRAAEQV